MTSNIENLAIEAQQLSRAAALYFRDLFEFVSSNQDIPITISFIGLIVAISLKSFSIDDSTLPSLFLRFTGSTVLWGGLIIMILGILGAVVGVIFDLVLQQDSSFDFYKFYTVKFLFNVRLPAVIGLLIGMIIFVFIKRFIEPFATKLIQKGAKRGLDVDSIPEVQNVQKLLFKTQPYDPRKYFNEAASKKSIFLGLDSEHKAIYVERGIWQESNGDIIGVPGAGKGISAAVQIYQSILNGDACLLLNPKSDEWAESVYFEACSQIGKPLLVIDCSEDSFAQINPLQGINSHDLYELLISVFNLSRQGEAADFYRNNDRKGARIISKLADSQAGNLSLPHLYQQSLNALGDFSKFCDGLLCQLEELASLSAVQTAGGIDLAKFIDTGGCLLIKGSTRNETVKTLVNMLLVRAIQIVENRIDKSRHVSFFCDEVKHLINNTFISSLGSIRDKGANFIIAHQSLADLEVEGAGMSALAVRRTIIEDTSIRWIYKSSDYETALWVSQLCGTKNGVEEVRESTSNSLAAENVGLGRRFHTTEIPVIHTNIIQNLPKFCAVCIGAVSAGSVLAFTSPIIVPKITVPLCPAPSLDHDEFGDELL